MERTLETDVLIIGSEGAGCRAAIEARHAGAEVLVVSKLYRARSGSTICAPGDYACDSASLKQMGMDGAQDGDSPDVFYDDVLDAGKQLNEPSLARLLVEDAPARFQDLLDYGADFTRALKYSGHQYARSACIGRVGKTGVGMMKALGKAAGDAGADLYEAGMVLALSQDDTGQVCGAVSLDFTDGAIVQIRAKAVIIATGGAARAFSMTSNPEEQTGDGMVMAYDVGADLVDMEMMQFIPYAQAYPTSMAGNIHFAYELVSLLPSYLLNSEGERFMATYDPERMEKSTRDFLSFGIASEVAAGRGSPHHGAIVALDHIPPEQLNEFIDDMFPNWRVGAFDLRKFGFDPATDPVEIAPASHYSCGGIRIDDDCATTVPGLFAAGEVAGAVMGGTRLSGAALTENQVFGAIAGRTAAAFARESTPGAIVTGTGAEVAERIAPVLAGDGARNVWQVREDVLEVGSSGIGPIRSHDGLEQALASLDVLDDELDAGIHIGVRDTRGNLELVKWFETKNMIDVLRMTAHGALRRTESRGSHQRIDAPHPSDEVVHTIVRRDDDTMAVDVVPVGSL